MAAMMTGSVLVESLTLAGHGRWRDRIRLDDASGFTVGRGLDADVILDDPHVAPRHARIEVGEDGVVRVTDLGSINGVIVSGQRHHGVAGLVAPAGEFRLGRTLLRVRSPAQAVAPERPDRTASYSSRSIPFLAFACALLSGGYMVYLNWLGAPRDLVASSVTSLLLMAGGAGIWCGAWALLSRMLLGEWRGILHAAILFGVATLLVILANALDLAWFSLSLPGWESRPVLLLVVAAGVMLFLHLRQATHLTRWHTVAVAVLLPAVLGGGGLWVQWRAEARDVNHIGMNERVYPPAFRLGEAADAGAFFARVRELKARADERRETLEADDGPPAEDPAATEGATAH